MSAIAPMEFHPLAGVFPLIEGTEFDAIVEDVRAHGLTDAIVVFEGKILDGRNRWLACRAAKTEPNFVDFAGPDAASFVVSRNLKRRHLSESQRAMVAAKLATLSEGRPGKTAPIGAVSQDEAAEMLNVSRRNVQRATRIQNNATQQLIQAVEKGKVTVNAADLAVSRPVSEQNELASTGRTENLRARNRNNKTTRSVEKSEDSDDDDIVEDPENFRTSFMLRVDQAIQFANCRGCKPTKEFVTAALNVASAWERLALEMEKQL